MNFYKMTPIVIGIIIFGAITNGCGVTDPTTVIEAEKVETKDSESEMVESDSMDNLITESESFETVETGTPSTIIAIVPKYGTTYDNESFTDVMTKSYPNAPIQDYWNENIGYHMTTASVSLDPNWGVEVCFMNFDTEEGAKKEWDTYVAGKIEAELEEYATPNDETINGYENETVSYWFVDGYTYTSCYSCIVDNTILHVDGYVNDWDGHIPTEEEGKEMQQVCRDVLDVLRYNY